MICAKHGNIGRGVSSLDLFSLFFLNKLFEKKVHLITKLTKFLFKVYKMFS